MAKKYGVEKDALEGNKEERKNAIAQIEDEIVKKKQLAALEQESSIDYKKSGGISVWDTSFFGTSEKEVLTQLNGVQVSAKLSKEYTLQAQTVAELQEKLAGYITKLQNKSNKDKGEQKDLEKLTKLYNQVTDSLDTYKEGYSQTLKNFESGIPITTEQANVLYNLGEITSMQRQNIETYNETMKDNNDISDEAKEKFLEITAGIEQETDALAGLSDAEIAIKDALDEANSKYSKQSKALDEIQKSYDTLKSVVDDYNSNGFLTIDNLQKLLELDDQYLSALSLENGQLVLNTQALDEKTDALVAAKVEQMQSAAIMDIWAIAAGNDEKASALANAAIKTVGDNAVTTGDKFQSAVPGIESFTNALLGAKTAAGETTNVENFEEKANAVISSYQELFKSVTSLGAGTSGRGGYASGSTHKYSGSGKKSSGSSKKSGSGSSSKSTKEEYKAEVDYLYAWKNALENTKDEVDKLKDTLEDTDSFDEQEKVLRQLIDATNAQMRATQDLKQVQSSAINDNIKQLQQYGFQIDYNSEKNELYIQNMAHLADFTGDTAKAVEKLIKKVQDLNDDNRDLDGSVRDLTSDVKDYYEQISEIPEKKLKKFKELMEDFQQTRLDQVQNQIDDLQHELENDPRLKALEKQIEALENQNDELDKQKDLDEKILAVEEAKEKLANANKQRNIQIYREGIRLDVGAGYKCN